MKKIKKFVGSALKSGSVGDGKQDIFFMVPKGKCDSDKINH